MSEMDDVINQAISDFDDIEAALEEQGISVPSGTDTRTYGALVRSIPNANNITIDQTYNPESENPQSGIAVAEALTEYSTLFGDYQKLLYKTKDAISTTASITFDVNNTYEYITELTTLTLAGTEPTDGIDHYWKVNFKSGATATQLTAPTDWVFQGSDCTGGVFIPTTNATYELIFTWICGAMKVGVYKWVY